MLSLVDRQGRPRDGILRLNDIFRLQLSAELVVLSGCETAWAASFAAKASSG